MNYPLRKRGSRAFFAAASFVRIAVAPTFAVSLGLAGAAASAQEVATGSVTGRVLNASNGMYLNKAKVVVEGTNIETLTNDFGEFRLLRVPAGEAKITVTYIGQEPKTVTVNVETGKAAELDVSLGKADVGDDGVIKLDPYVVQSERFKNAQEIAINEERYSPNIKNVVAADAFGDIPSGNVGEFVKFMPGILIQYGGADSGGNGTADADPTGINIRGMGAADTAITIDGVPVSNAFPGSLTRQVFLDTLSINNASRVEVTKVPTPDMPANSVGGSVNLVSRSAFEYAKPTFNYSLYITGNSEHISTKETPGPVNKDTRKMNPAATFSASYPLTKSFGFTVSGSYVPEFKTNQRASMTWTPGTIPASSVLAPMTVEQAQAALAPVYAQQKLERYQIADTPQMSTRTSANLKVDWKPFPGHALSVNFQGSSYDSIEGQRNLDYRTGTASAYGPDYTLGQLNSNGPRIAMVVRARDRVGTTRSGYLKYQFTHGGWSFNATANHSISKSEYQDVNNAHFSEVAAIIGNSTGANAVTVNLRDIKDGIVGKVEVIGTGGSGTAIDTTKLVGWRFDSLSARSGEAFSEDTVDLYQADLRRELDFLPFATKVPLALKAGFRRDEKQNRKFGRGSGYGEELQTGKTVNFVDVIDDRYVDQSPGYGLPAQQWLSAYRLYGLEQTNDYFAVVSEAQKVSNWNSFVNQQKYIKETKDAWYVQLEGRALKGRLNFVGGVRQEEKSVKGRGPYTDNRWNFVKALDGTVYREANTVVTVNGVGYLPYVNGVTFNNSGNITVARADGTGTGSIPNPFYTSNDGGIRSRMQSAGLWFPTNADGTPRVITSGTLEARMLQLQPNRPINTSSKNDPAFSMNVSFDITKDLVAKLAWSRTFKQVDLESGNLGLLSGNGAFVFDEFSVPTVAPDGQLYLGRIQMANPSIQPETSQNWDAALSYYTKNGGSVTVSYYWKTIENQIVNLPIFPGSTEFDLVLEAAGYSPAAYEDFYVTTSVNSDGSQKTSGLEVSFKQEFSFLGSWGKHFAAFGSFTKKNLGDPKSATPIVINGVTVTPTNQRTITLSSNTFAAGGISFSNKRFSANVRATYKNRNEVSRSSISYTPTGGTSTVLNYIRNFEPAETRWDASLDYRISDKFSAYVTGKDLFNAERKRFRQDDLGWIPDYAKYVDYRRFGIEVTVGIRGSF